MIDSEEEHPVNSAHVGESINTRGLDILSDPHPIRINGGGVRQIIPYTNESIDEELNSVCDVGI